MHQDDSVTVNDKPVTVTPPTQEAPEDYVVRDEIFALHLAVTVSRAEFYPSCTKSSLAVPKRGCSAKPSPYDDNDPGGYDLSIYSTSSPPHFPGPLMSNLQLPVDMTVASCHVVVVVVVATRDLIAIIHRESRIPNRHTRMDLVLVGNRWCSRH
jgi:Auxiliary Activity family 9 (formerly GH61)